MEAFDWEGLPPRGTRVRVPHGRTTIEGEVVHLYRLFGRPAAKVRVELPVSHDPYEAHDVHVTFRPGELEVISD